MRGQAVRYLARDTGHVGVDGSEVDRRIRRQVVRRGLEGRAPDGVEVALVAAATVAEGGEAAADGPDVVAHPGARVVGRDAEARGQRRPDLAAEAEHEAPAAPQGEVPRRGTVDRVTNQFQPHYLLEQIRQALDHLE